MVGWQNLVGPEGEGKEGRKWGSEKEGEDRGQREGETERGRLLFSPDGGCPRWKEAGPGRPKGPSVRLRPVASPWQGAQGRSAALRRQVPGWEPPPVLPAGPTNTRQQGAWGWEQGRRTSGRWSWGVYGRQPWKTAPKVRGLGKLANGGPGLHSAPAPTAQV